MISAPSKSKQGGKNIHAHNSVVRGFHLFSPLSSAADKATASHNGETRAITLFNSGTMFFLMEDECYRDVSPMNFDATIKGRNPRWGFCGEVPKSVLVGSRLLLWP